MSKNLIKPSSGPVRRRSAIVPRAVFLLFTLLFSACSTVDFEAPKDASYADVDTSDTRLGRRLAPLREARHPESGFSPLFRGVDALSARLLAIGLAEKTLDVQYYLVGNDPIGAVFFEALLSAADRGVRVRLLIDDIGTAGIEEQLGPLNSHPNVELRLFNPFASRNARGFDGWDLYRLSRRMHNKTLIADQEFLIFGGRNIAAEYFAANPAYNFGDIDAAAIGSVAKDASAMFDRYWNDRSSIPYLQLTGSSEGTMDLPELRDVLSTMSRGLAGSPYASVVGDRVVAMKDIRAEDYLWSPYKMVYDDPGKALSDDVEPEEKLIYSLGRLASAAKEELFIISPYFVPRKEGVDWLSEIAATGVQVSVLTNGLAANDHLVVYGGYAPVRKPLLKKGIRFYEFRGDITFEGTETLDVADADSKLHGKAFVVDRRYLFIGSFNWDPRSANLNTEMGVVIDNSNLAGEFVSGMNAALDEHAYAVYLDDGALRWRTTTAGNEQVFRKEPETGWWKRFVANLTRFLPIRGQL